MKSHQILQECSRDSGKLFSGVFTTAQRVIQNTQTISENGATEIQNGKMNFKVGSGQVALFKRPFCSAHVKRHLSKRLGWNLEVKIQVFSYENCKILFFEKFSFENGAELLSKKFICTWNYLFMWNFQKLFFSTRESFPGSFTWRDNFMS